MQRNSKIDCKGKFISQINGGLMFFVSARIRNFVQYGKNQFKRKEHNQHSSAFKVLR